MTMRTHKVPHSVNQYLTECGLTAIRGDKTTHDLEEMNCPDCRAALIAQGTCPVCGSTDLSWDTFPVNKSRVVDGRLSARDVVTEFHLGCGECSETLISGVHPDDVAKALTEHRWRPDTATRQQPTAPQPLTPKDLP